jgi:hypothetical protein
MKGFKRRKNVTVVIYMQKTGVEPVFLDHEPNRLPITAFLLFDSNNFICGTSY